MGLSSHWKKKNPVHAMKANRGRWGIAPLILNLGTRLTWSVARPGCFTLGKETRYPVNGRLGGLQRQSWRFAEGKNLLLSRTGGSNRPARNLDTVPTTRSRLLKVMRRLWKRTSLNVYKKRIVIPVNIFWTRRSTDLLLISMWTF